MSYTQGKGKQSLDLGGLLPPEITAHATEEDPGGTPRSSIDSDFPSDYGSDDDYLSQDGSLAGDMDEEEVEWNDAEDVSPEAEFPNYKSRTVYHSTATLMAIMDEHLLTSIQLKKGVTRTETEAFEPIGPMTYPSIRRKEFAAYIRHTGFIRSISRILLKLYQSKDLPEVEDAVQYIATSLGYSLTPRTNKAEMSRLDIQLFEQMTAKINKVRQDIDNLRRQLDNYEDTETPIEIIQPDAFPPFTLQGQGPGQRRSL